MGAPRGPSRRAASAAPDAVRQGGRGAKTRKSAGRGGPTISAQRKRSIQPRTHQIARGRRGADLPRSAARLRVPAGRPQSGHGREEVHPVRRTTVAGQIPIQVGDAKSEPQPFPGPVDRRRRRVHRAFDGVEHGGPRVPRGPPRHEARSVVRRPGTRTSRSPRADQDERPRPVVDGDRPSARQPTPDEAPPADRRSSLTGGAAGRVVADKSATSGWSGAPAGRAGASTRAPRPNVSNSSGSQEREARSKSSVRWALAWFHGVHRSAAQPPDEKRAEGAPQRPPRSDAAPQSAERDAGPRRASRRSSAGQPETGPPADRFIEVAAGPRLSSQP